MVDAERLHRLLRRVADDLGRLQRYAEADAEALQRDEVRLGHAKYLMITLLEGSLDAAHHVCAAEGYGPPGTNAEAMLLLAEHGVLQPATAAAMAQAVRFRNVLVHGYVDVDDARVVAYLSELDDVRAFVAALAALLSDR